MAYKVLYRKYRPDTFDNLFGQDHIKDILIKSIENNKIAQAYLFCGPRGTGKTSTAKIFARAINCKRFEKGNICNECDACLAGNDSPDVIEIDAASNNGVDEIRTLRENANILPTLGNYKVYIIDEVHMLSQSAWNAFLKILEEPPKHVVFILATTDVQKVPKTIKSRCQCFNFRNIDNDIIEFNIKRICDIEKIDISPEAAKTIAELSLGGMRDALSMLDQLSKENVKITNDSIQSVFGQVSIDDIEKMFLSISNNDIDMFCKIYTEYEKNGIDYNSVTSKIYDYLFKLELNTITDKKTTFYSVDKIKQICFDVAKCTNIKELKVILLSYFAKVNEKSIQEDIKITNDIEKNENLVIEEKKETKKVNNSIKKDSIKNVDKDFIDIRVNNSFVNVNIEEKKKFIALWEDYLEIKKAENDYDILSIVENISIGIVSPTNVTFYDKSMSTAKLFNNHIDKIEDDFYEIKKCKYAFICISEERYISLRSNYNKSQNYVYINEKKDSIINSEALNTAYEIFGEENVYTK